MVALLLHVRIHCSWIKNAVIQSYIKLSQCFTETWQCERFVVIVMTLPHGYLCRCLVGDASGKSYGDVAFVEQHNLESNILSKNLIQLLYIVRLHMATTLTHHEVIMVYVQANSYRL